ncbi:hypothetical protein B0H13DRAFT_2669461 [Mycena leptocephala]|nr:hypothetical protein B0H13DRAFT_2669461 [Mycena leptocephala]
MNDANGGKGQLQGYISDVDFTCGGVGYDAAYLLVKNESGLEYKDEERLALSFRDPPTKTDFETYLFETNTEMTSRSAPVSPAPPRYTPRPFLRNVGTFHENGSFGPIDPHPREASVLSRVQAASDTYWLQHRQGNDLTVRPGSVVSPQTLFTGRERRANGQETLHAILLNARLLIHNPRTGEPGAVNGHASVQLHAAPSNNRLWNLETPYATDQQIQETLTNYGSGVHREQDESSSDESSVSEGWRARPIHAPRPMRPLDVQRIVASSHLQGVGEPVRGYITHPDGNPPPFDTSQMQNIGRTPTGDHVLQFPDPTRSQADIEGMERPGTPRLPWTLMHDPPVLSSVNNPRLAVDAWTSQSSVPAERWNPLNGNVERVHYNARACNWMCEDSTTGIPSGTTAGRNEEEEPSAASGVEGEVATSSEAEMEEGEVRDESAAPREENTRVQTTDAQALTRTTDPRLQSRADVVPIPVIGSGRKGAVITRSCYSSSASPASIDSTVDPSIYSRRSITRSPLSISERILEAERIIAAAVHRVSSADPLFDFEYDSSSDSPPELLEGDSSDEQISSDSQIKSSGKIVTVRTADCLEALAYMRRAAPTPDRDPEVRNAAMKDLEEWSRQQARLQDGVRCSENHRALRPMRDGMEVLRLYLEDIVDRDTMALEARGNQSWPDALADSASENALNLISRPAGDGKRKICDDFIVAITRDEKRLRRMGGEALAWDPARRAGLYAEGRRLQNYLAPLINLRGFVLLCMGQLNDLAIRRQYPLDVSGIGHDVDVPTPFLKWEEHAKLTCLQRAFAQDGQMNVAIELDAFLKIRFHDARILARMLHANVFDASDYTPVPEDVETNANDMRAAECMLGNSFVSRALTPGLFSHTPPPPTWLLQGDCHSQAHGERMLNKSTSPGRSSPFRIFDGRGHYRSIRAVPSQFRPVDSAMIEYNVVIFWSMPKRCSWTSFSLPS